VLKHVWRGARLLVALAILAAVALLGTGGVPSRTRTDELAGQVSGTALTVVEVESVAWALAPVGARVLRHLRHAPQDVAALAGVLVVLLAGRTTQPTVPLRRDLVPIPGRRGRAVLCAYLH
jgi:hypothetical protein